MNNISITAEMYVESGASVVKLDVQCDYRLQPLFLIASAIARLKLLMNYFVSLSQAYDIAADKPSMSSYRFTFL